MKKNILITTLLLGCGLIQQSALAQVSSDLALKQLSQSAKQKVLNNGINLDALLKNDSNDLIVEYDASGSSSHLGQDLRNFIQERKQSIRNRYNQRAGFQLLREYNTLPLSFHRINNRDTLVDVLNDPNVKAVYPNRVSYAVTDQSYELIGQKTAASKGFKADGTTVAVLDTGVNYRHADFGNCSAPGVPSTCRVSHSVEIAREDYSLDDSGHGSNVSGIISKVALNSKIAVLDVFTGQGAYDNDIVSALNWVANNAKTLNIKSVNLSLGSPTHYSSTCGSSSLTTSFNNLRNLGVIPVVASGNEGYTSGVSYPACTAGAVSVGAVYDSNIGRVGYSTCTDSSTYSDKVTCFSNTGSNLTLLAPGSQMTAGGYTQSGTSQASPHVAAAIAILRAPNAFPNETLDQTVERLKTSGNLVTDQRNNIRIPRLNISAALSGATPPPVTNPPVVNPPVTNPPVVNPPVTPPQPEKNCRTIFFVTICSG